MLVYIFRDEWHIIILSRTRAVQNASKTIRSTVRWCTYNIFDDVFVFAVFCTISRKSHRRRDPKRTGGLRRIIKFRLESYVYIYTILYWCPCKPSGNSTEFAKSDFFLNVRSIIYYYYNCIIMYVFTTNAAILSFTYFMCKRISLWRLSLLYYNNNRITLNYTVYARYITI